VKLYVTSDAEQDLDEIESYIGKDNPRAAVNFVAQLTDRFSLLSRSPGIGHKRDELVAGSRSVSEGNYLIVYRTSSDTVEILRVLHGARDLEQLFSTSVK
jgi:toxin ParE1/3/4